MSTKCGESDTTSGLAANPTVGRVFERLADAGATLIFGETTEVTGGEDIIAAQCVDARKCADGFMQFFNDYQALVKSKGVDLLGSQPTEGNIRGGLTTIEEKAMGNIQKMGRCTVVGVLDKAVEPQKPGPALHGLVLRRGRDGHAVRGGRVGGPLLPHRPGQRHRQPDHPGHQAVRATR